LNCKVNSLSVEGELMLSLAAVLRPARVGVLLASLVLWFVAGCGDNESVDPPEAVAPRLVIVGPATGSVLPTPMATLQFRIEDAPAIGYTVKVGDALPTEVTRDFAMGESVSLQLELVTGVNTIAVTLAGQDGTGDEGTLVLVVEENAAPVVELDEPAATTFAASLTVAGRILAARPITTATAQVGAGTPVALSLTAAPGGYTFTGEVELALGDNTLAIDVVDDREQHGEATASITRMADITAPVVTIEYPRDGQAVRTRRVVVRGRASDQSSVSSVEVTSGSQTVTATLEADGSFHATVDVSPALGELEVHAIDGFGNEARESSHVFYGARLGAGGSHSGAIWNGALYTWGRNNLAQTGLAYASHESRTAFCDRTLTAARDIALCKAVTVTNVDAICLNPDFVTPAPADSPEALACRTATRATRDSICDAAGALAPANCKTVNTVNLASICDLAYGTGSPMSTACKARLVCDGAYASGSVDHATCVATASSVPSVFPSPAAPYTPVMIPRYSPTAAPAPVGGGVALSTLGISFTALAFNQNASSALDSEGRVWSWGDGASGMLCLGDSLQRQIPHRVDAFGEAGTTAIALSRGYDHLLVLRSDGSVWGCGLNNVGQIGDGTSGTSRELPTRVAGLPANIIQVLATSQSSYALTADGQVYAWGRNQYGNLGNGTAGTSTTVAATPALVPGLSDIVMIAGGRDHVLALTRAGSIYGWGLNASNQVNGSDGNVLSPVLIDGVTDARAVYANGTQGFYEDPMGRLFGWGANGSGNLGIPDDEDQLAPSMPVFGISNVLDVGIGALHGFVLRGDQVFGWGWSFHGSLGASTSAIHTWPYRTPLVVQLPAAN
jgi:alpha-tubulin suppressor-like RCC1 family protein